MAANRLAWLVIAAGLAGAAVGCAVGPHFHKPAAPTGAGYTTVPLPQATASADALGGDAQRFVTGRDISFEWWQAFGSPALDSLVEKAFRANPSIKAAQAALRQAQELVYAQQGNFFPAVNADYNFDRQKLAGHLSGTSAPGVQPTPSHLPPLHHPPPHP